MVSSTSGLISIILVLSCILQLHFVEGQTGTNSATPAVGVKTIKIAAVVAADEAINFFDDVTVETQQGILCVMNMWADMWNAKNVMKDGEVIKVELEHVPVTSTNVAVVGADVVTRDYDYIWIETNLIGLSHEVFGKSGKIVISNSPYLVCTKGSTNCIPGGPLYSRVFSATSLLNHAWWQGALSLTISHGAKSLYYVTSAAFSTIYDDFHGYASQFSFLEEKGKTDDITDDMTQAQITERMRQARDANADMLVIMTNYASCPLVYKALEELQWTPKSIWTLLCFITDSFLETVVKPPLTQNAWQYTLSRFTDPTYFSDPRLSELSKAFLNQYATDFYFEVPAGSDQTTFDVFQNTLSRKYDEIFSTPHIGSCKQPYNHNFPSTFLGGELIGDSILRTISWDPEEIENALRQADFNTFALTFTMNKDTSISATTIQQTPDGPRLLSPAEWSTSGLIYPMPTFEERIPPSTDLSISEIVLYAFTGAIILLCIIAFVMTIVLRNSPVIKASSPPFLALICLGLAIGSSCIFFWRYTYRTTPDCHLHVWLLNMGFSISFGALFVRTLKIDRLWNARTLDGKPLSNIQLGIIFSSVVSLQVVLLVLWSAIGQPEAAIVSPDPLRPINNFYICDTGPGNDILLGLMVGCSGFLLLIGAVLAYRVRDVPMKVVNESKMIAVSIYNLLVFSIVIVILEVSDISSELIFIIRSILILISAFLTLVLLFVSKIRARVILDDTVTSSSGTVVGGSTASSAVSTVAMKALEDQKDAEIHKLKEEIARLKKGKH